MSGEAEMNAVLGQLGEVKGALQVILQVINANNTSTNQRIDDMRLGISGRMDSIETRLATMEKNERGTALKAASGGAVSAAIVTGALELIRYVGTR